MADPVRLGGSEDLTKPPDLSSMLTFSAYRFVPLYRAGFAVLGLCATVERLPSQAAKFLVGQPRHCSPVEYACGLIAADSTSIVAYCS